MTEPPTLLENLPPEAPIPESPVSPESVLCTEELLRRPTRPPDYQKENRALVTLAGALAGSKSTILQTLAETILDLTQSDSSGISLLTREDGGKRFYWPVIAGAWKPYIGGGTPRDFGPSGDVLDKNRTLLFRRFERRYPYLLPITPPAEECLLVPFYFEGEAVGTIWAIMHTDRRQFDAEDERLMTTLAHFASLAYQTLTSVDNLKVQMAARDKAETAVRDWAIGLEAELPEDLRKMHVELAHVNRVMTMGALSASIAHEVSQPLAAIVASGDSCTAWLASEPPNLGKARSAAGRMTQAAMQASEIVQRIRALFKKTPSAAKPLEINEVVTEALSLVHSEARRKGVLLDTELAANLPEVLGDRVQLEQVILNLFVNGIEAMAAVENQPRRLRIQSATAGPRDIQVSIADTGPGIDPQHMAQLFAPFFTTKPEGIGMGLSISRSIIETHHGRLWATRNVPRGAVFHFTLPATAPTE